jgi:hypothetical protein
MHASAHGQRFTRVTTQAQCMRLFFGRLHLTLASRHVPGDVFESADCLRERFIFGSGSGRFATPPNHWWRSLNQSLCCAVACSQECATSRYPPLQLRYFIIISRLPQVAKDDRRFIYHLAVVSACSEDCPKEASKRGGSPTIPPKIDTTVGR